MYLGKIFFAHHYKKSYKETNIKLLKYLATLLSNSLKPVARSSVSPAKSHLGPKGPSPPQELERSPP